MSALATSWPRRPQEPAEDAERILVVLDQQDPERPALLCGLGRVGDDAPVSVHVRGRCDGGHLDPERRAALPSLAARGEPAAVELDERAADRQAEAEPAEPPGDRRVPLLEGVEDPRERLGVDPLARVDDLDDQPAALAVAGADRERAAGRRELHAVLDQVPVDLLEPRGVGLDVMGVRVEGDVEPQVLLADVADADLQRLAEQLVRVDGPGLQPELTAADPGHVEQVVDQPGLEVDVAADHPEHRAIVLRRGRVVEHRGDGGEHRRQRSAQLVAEDGEELVLGAIGGVGGVLRGLEVALGLLPPRDVEPDADDADRPAERITEDPAPAVDPGRHAVRGDDPELDLEFVVTGQRTVDRGAEGRPIVGVDQLEEASEGPAEGAVGQAEDVVEVLRPLDLVGEEVPVPGPHPGHIEGEPELLLAVP